MPFCAARRSRPAPRVFSPFDELRAELGLIASAASPVSGALLDALAEVRRALHPAEFLLT